MPPLSPTTTPTRIVIVRHGATEWSVVNRHTGRTDVPLTEDGRAEAVALRPLVLDAIRHVGLAGVAFFSSPLSRARDTAHLALPEFDQPDGPQLTVVDALTEWDYGSIEGHTALEVRQTHPDWELLRDGTPDGETLRQVTARCESFIAKLERVAGGRTAVVFTHGHTGRVLATLLLGWPPITAGQLHNDTASIGIVELRREHYVLSAWNLHGRGIGVA